MKINNKLIAEFMDLKNTGMSIYKPSQYKYHSSWDWLMPVVDKIEAIEDENRCAKYNVNVVQCFVEIVENHTSEELVVVDKGSRKESVYHAVVEFIKWYNKN